MSTLTELELSRKVRKKERRKRYLFTVNAGMEMTLKMPGWVLALGAPSRRAAVPAGADRFEE